MNARLEVDWAYAPMSDHDGTPRVEDIVLNDPDRVAASKARAMARQLLAAAEVLELREDGDELPSAFSADEKREVRSEAARAAHQTIEAHWRVHFGTLAHNQRDRESRTCRRIEEVCRIIASAGCDTGDTEQTARVAIGLLQAFFSPDEASVAHGHWRQFANVIEAMRAEKKPGKPNPEWPAMEELFRALGMPMSMDSFRAAKRRRKSGKLGPINR